jgi:hypothetical protein
MPDILADKPGDFGELKKKRAVIYLPEIGSD